MVKSCTPISFLFMLNSFLILEHGILFDFILIAMLHSAEVTKDGLFSVGEMECMVRYHENLSIAGISFVVVIIELLMDSLISGIKLWCVSAL